MYTMYMYDICKHSHTPPSIRTEQNRTCIGLKSIYKGLLPKQHIKYKTKTVNYNQTTFVHIYMFETHDSLMTFSMRRWYILNMI